MAQPIVSQYTEGHGEPHCLELHVYRSPKDKGKMCAMMQGIKPGHPNPGYGDVAVAIAPYPIQVVSDRDSAIRLGMETAERHGYPVVLLKDDTKRK